LKKKVGERQYPDSVIKFILTVGCIYRLPLRQCIGLVRDLLAMRGIGHLPIPNYSTLSRRQEFLSVQVSTRLQDGRPLDISIDSTGIKVYGEGEWKVRCHGYSKRRTWMKLHVVIDVDTQEIVLVDLTDNSKHDADAGAEMLKGNLENVKECLGDGAYDKFAFRKVLGQEIVQVIPPPKNAVASGPDKEGKQAGHLEQRDDAILQISIKERGKWKQFVGYHRRSRNEVAMYRFKATFGDRFKARRFDNQVVEVKLKSVILNNNRAMGMPKSKKVA
jgi:hypothetical protein